MKLPVFLALVAALLSLGGAASAQSLELLVTESGGPTIPITDNGALDTDPTVGVINADVTLLNLSLVNYSFSDLQAHQMTNALSQQGSASLLLGGTGSVAVLGTADTFLAPAGNPKTMTTVAADTFRNTTAGDSRTFQSFFNPTNTLGAKEIPSSLLAFFPPVGSGPFSTSNPGVDTPLGSQPIPYGLTNQTVITLNSGNGNDQFSGTTTINATLSVPEPSSLAFLLVSGISGAGFLLKRRRK